MFLVVFALFIGFMQGLMAYGTLELCVSWDYSYNPQTGNIWVPRLVEWSPIDERRTVYTILLAVSFGLGLISTLIAWVVVPHWQRVHHILFNVAWASLAGAVVTMIWWSYGSQLFTWGVGQIAMMTLVYILGGLVATFFGRQVVRFIGQVCLPMRVRTLVERTSSWLLDDNKAT